MAESRVSPGDRNGLVVDACLTHATGTAEPEAALAMLEALPDAGHKTVGADKAYDTAAFVTSSRAAGVTPHVAQNINAHRGSNIDRRTTRHAGYRLSQVVRKRIEEANGWIKEVGGMAQRDRPERGGQAALRNGWRAQRSATANPG